MASYVLTIVGYPATDSIGTFEWGIAGTKGQLLAAGRGTITGSGTTAPLAVERLTYHALLTGLQALLAEDYVGALTIAAAPAFIALLRPGEQSEDPDLQRLRQQAIQLLNQIRSALTLHEQVVVPPLFVEATELARRAAKPLPPRVIAFVTQLNANPGAVTDEDLNRLQIRGTDTYSRIRLPELVLLVESAIVAQAQAAFPDAPTSHAVVCCAGICADSCFHSPCVKPRFPRKSRPGRATVATQHSPRGLIQAPLAPFKIAPSLPVLPHTAGAMAHCYATQLLHRQ